MQSPIRTIRNLRMQNKSAGIPQQSLKEEMTNVARNPKWLDTLEPLKVLGKGGQGQVILAKDPQRDVFVAVKWSKFEKDVSFEVLEDRLRTYHKAQRVIPGILWNYGMYEREQPDGKYLVIVNEYIEGQDLHHFVKEGEYIDIFDFSVMGCELFSTLSKMHTYGIVHRDLKDDNVMVDTLNNRYVIIDMGFFCELGKCPKNITGTKGYFSPELKREFAKKNKRNIKSLTDEQMMASDVFALTTTADHFAELVEYEEDFYYESAEILEEALECGLAYDYTKRATAREMFLMFYASLKAACEASQ